jgi:large repetitive protein
MKKISYIFGAVTFARFAMVLVLLPYLTALANTDKATVTAVFNAGKLIANDRQTEAIAAGDVDGDGDTDLIFGQGSNGVLLALGDGHDGFGAQVRIGSESIQVLSVVLADIDADGDLDLLVGRVSQPILIYLNEGHGKFAKHGIEISAEKIYASKMALADVDADGDLDLIVGGHTIAPRLFINEGSGQFSVSSRHIGDERTVSMALVLGDVDGDGDVDLITSDGSHTPLKMYLNNGVGDFTEVVKPFPDAKEARSTVLADVDGDGDLDLFTTGHKENILYYNNSHGVFTARTAVTSAPGKGSSNAIFGDIDGDADLDLFVLNSENPDELFVNDGKGNFYLSSQIGGNNAYNCCAVFSDLDTDHDLDLIVISGAGRDGKTYLNDSSRAPLATPPNLLAVIPTLKPTKIESPDNASIFSAGQRLTTDVNGEYFAVADIDGDGDVDVVLSRTVDRKSFITVYRNNGHAELTRSAELNDVTSDVATIRSSLLADMDGDTKPDLLVAYNQTGNGPRNKLISLHHNNGDGTFAKVGVGIGLQADSTNDLIAVDIDGDADLDLIAGNREKSKRYLNDGGGSFGAGRAINRDRRVSNSIVAADIDADGDNDLISGNDQDGIELYENTGNGVFDADAVMLYENRARNWQLVARDLDSDGDVDIFAGGTITLALLNDGQGQFVVGHALSGARYVALADVDLDGDIDYLAGDTGTPMKLFLNDGHAGWKPDSRAIESNYSRAFVMTDLDGDGDSDLLALTGSGDGLVLYVNSTNMGAADNRIARKIAEEKHAAMPALVIAPVAPVTTWGKWQLELSSLDDQYNIKGIGMALLFPLLLYFLLRRKNN